MRLFIAINLSDEMKDALRDAQNRMYRSGVRGSYTPPENMHLTLAFIGEYPDAEPITDALSAVSFAPFELSLDGMGCFGNLWWAGIGESAPLTALVRKLRRALAENGIPFDRKRFSPHVTLIRKASGKLPAIQLQPASMTVNAGSLMRSDRGRNGMIYTELFAWEAQG
ncbi:MAG: RNA 2',3'-cyclic phosphodiesterase [Oscillospiraceae bacterium]|nr:RNA 2',3'-cyclic phosphodiesterase [Oscillospiraceae bacterium]